MMVVMFSTVLSCSAHVEYVNDGSDVLHCPLSCTAQVEYVNDGSDVCTILSVYCSRGVRE
jgi:hypothetical protein